MDDLLSRLNAELGHSYTIEHELGGGGMSRVFVAEDRSLGRKVVIKVLPTDLGSGFNIERFRREVRLAATLQHPHIVPLLVAGGESLPYYTMPLVQGESLRARLDREGELPIPTALRILRDVADALAYAHEQGIVHRDIKPDNVLLSGPHALVTDFGVAKALAEGAHSDGSSLTSAGLALGTPAYMAPEQAAADPNVDHRADIYALGAMAYEMFTAAPPFDDLTPQQVLAAQITRAPEPIGIRRPALPPPVASLVMRCLEKSPADRWQSARELVNELERIGTPSSVATPDVPVVTKGPVRLSLQITIACILLLATAGGWAWYRASHRPVVLDSDVIAVLPFRVTGADATYGEGMVDLLAAKLTGEGGPRATDPRSVMSAWRRVAADGDLPQAEAVGLARRLGAGRLLLGSIVGTPGQLTLTASVLNAQTGKEENRGEIVGPPDSMMFLVDRLAAQVLAGGAGARGHQLYKLTSTSLPALKSYLAAQSSYRRGGYEEAMESYRRAVEQDSSFALAAIGLASSAHWLGLWPSRDSAFGLAERLRTRLVGKDAAYLDMKEAMAGYPDPGVARNWTDASQRMVDIAPDAPEGWYELGDSYFHAGLTMGLSRQESLERAERAFRRAAELDSGFVAPLEHLVEVAAIREDTASVRAFGRLYFRVDSVGDLADFVRWRVAAGTGDSVMLDSLLDDFDRMSFPSLARIQGTAVLDGIRLEDADSVFAELRRRPSPRPIEILIAQGHRIYLLNRGRPSEAAKFYQTSPPPPQQEGPLWDALYGDGDTLLARSTMTALKPQVAGKLASDPRLRIQQYETICAAAVWLATRGDSTGARAAFRRLERPLLPSAETQVLRRMQTCLLAVRVQLTPTSDSTQLATWTNELDSLMGTIYFPQGLFIASRARERLGDLPGSLATIRRRVYHWATTDYLATMLREEGRLAAQSGDREGAIRAYQHYLRLREGAEPRLQPQVSQVREELARLIGEP